MFSCSFKSSKGFMKPFNEDHADFFTDKGVFFFLMADGQGSKTELERSSVLVIQEFKNLIVRSSFHDINSLAKEIARAYYVLNRLFSIFWSYEGEKLSQLTSGLTVLCVFENRQCLLAHMGNVRCGLIREGQVKYLSKDHTIAYDLYLSKQISYDELKVHPENRKLTRYFAQNDEQQLVEFQAGAFQEHDVLMLVSDGVYYSVTDEEILMLLAESSGNLPQACDYLLELAGERQSFDDRSIGFLVL